MGIPTRSSVIGKERKNLGIFLPSGLSALQYSDSMSGLKKGGGNRGGFPVSHIGVRELDAFKDPYEIAMDIRCQKLVFMN